MARSKGPKVDGYATEKFVLAVSTLSGLGSLQERIRDAYVYHIIHVDAVALPADRQEGRHRLEAAMGTQHDPVRGDASASADMLTDDEAREIADYIIDTAFELHRRWGMENIDGDE